MQASKMSANANVIQKTKLFVAPNASIAIIVNSTVLNALLNLSSLFIIILLSAAQAFRTNAILGEHLPMQERKTHFQRYNILALAEILLRLSYIPKRL